MYVRVHLSTPVGEYTHQSASVPTSEQHILAHRFGNSPLAAADKKGVVAPVDMVEVVCADTSYSDPRAADNRGYAVHEVSAHGLRCEARHARTFFVAHNGHACIDVPGLA